MTRVAVLLAAHSTNELCDLVERKDLSMQGIAELWGCTKRQLQLWIDSDYHRAQRAREARENAADWCDREAEKVLIALSQKPAATIAEITAARELAQHYRWRARVRNPSTHGDKVQVDHRLNLTADEMTDAQLEAFIRTASMNLAIEGECEELDE
jgi:hypothetical protein